MAEAPPPPPNLDYNSFRSWRKNNGIRGTQQELKTAWNEYKSNTTLLPGKKSPVRSPSKKTSPKQSPSKKSKSPTRYGGLSTAALTGLPTELDPLLTYGIDTKAIHGMLVASKKTGKMVAGHQMRMCSEPLTQLEMLSGLETLPFPISLSIKGAMDAVGRQPTAGILYIFDEDQKGIYAQTDLKKVYSKWKKPVRGFVESFIKNLGTKHGRQLFIMMSSPSFMAMHKRRISCHKLDATYLETQREHAREAFLAMARVALRFVAPGAIWEHMSNLIIGQSQLNDEWYQLFRENAGVMVSSVRYISSKIFLIAWICNNPTFLTTARQYILQMKKIVDNYVQLMILIVKTLVDSYASL